MTRSKRRMGWN